MIIFITITNLILCGLIVCPSGVYTAANDPLTVKTGLSLRIDAGIAASYPGSDTVWCDLSGYGNHLTWPASAAPKYLTYNGYGVLPAPIRLSVR